MTAKPPEGGSSVDDKGQSDKNWGDDKKSGVAKTPCQCVCHSKTKPVTTATPVAKPAVVDLTVTPCKEKSEPAHTAAQHGKCKCSGPCSTESFFDVVDFEALSYTYLNEILIPYLYTYYIHILHIK